MSEHSGKTQTTTAGDTGNVVYVHTECPECKRLSAERAELIDALLDTLYQAQYRKENVVCHDFISAYEYATALLVRLGYATTDDDVYYELRWPGNDKEASDGTD